MFGLSALCSYKASILVYSLASQVKKASAHPALYNNIHDISEHVPLAWLLMAILLYALYHISDTA